MPTNQYWRLYSINTLVRNTANVFAKQSLELRIDIYALKRILDMRPASALSTSQVGRELARILETARLALTQVRI